MTLPAVSAVRHRDYDRDRILDALRRCLEPLGGMAAFVPKGSRVVLKPNLVFGRGVDTAINTHPEIVRAAIVLAREAGAGRIVVGDSPGFGTGRNAAKACGILAVAEEEGAEFIEFTPVDSVLEGRTFVRLELARELLEADVIINLAKMKTHGQMLMSLAVKNMFGAVPGARKLQWHYRAGRDRMFFARALNDIAAAVRPALSVMDAVVGMDRLGPTAGRARPVGFVAASGNAWALDAAIMDVLGLDRDLLFTLQDAHRAELGEWEKYRWHGPDQATLRPDDWEIPELCTLHMHGGFVERRLPWLARWLREAVAPRPVVRDDCIGCGYCKDICPAKAMRMEDGRVVIDYAVCIRCCCCHELCQHHGMDMRSGGIVARLLGIRGK